LAISTAYYQGHKPNEVNFKPIKFCNYLTFTVVMGDNIPHNYMKRKVTDQFFDTHPVFSLEEAVKFLAPPGGRVGTIERLKYHLDSGRLKGIVREIYAVVPPGVSPDNFYPDPFLVAAAARPDCVFAYHSALELLGAAHSTWNVHTLFVQSPRREILLGEIQIKFLSYPKILLSNNSRKIGTSKVERQGKWLTTTGEERTLVEGFRNPQYAGGVEELLQSASGFSVLDLDLLEKILSNYNALKLWSAVGWFLEQFQKTFHVPDSYLTRLEIHKPLSPAYLLRSQRGGQLVERWNLIIPDKYISLAEHYAT
jgi:predicted transcriptional regulator of viral defense system